MRPLPSVPFSPLSLSTATAHTLLPCSHTLLCRRSVAVASALVDVCTVDTVPNRYASLTRAIFSCQN
ncbi:hypothetical protein VNO80_10528 [Phaseolus coccineus]|uniref:Uncharacterized protein n=1 Tax=Phaseolus coccineus TaxID=3886 RepID=A0AAN9N8Q7_PHACN